MKWTDLVSFGRFVQKNGFFVGGSKNETEFEKYEKLTTKDCVSGKHHAEPLMVTGDNDEVNLFGVESFSRNFTDIASLVANPGQGKSRLASTMYNLMRNTQNEYFKVSDGAISFTKGVWRISDENKSKALSMDTIDILDVEGLQKENSVYYLLISVVVLSKSIILLSRERVNKDALGVLEIAFKILDSLGIALKKPVLFIQTKFDDDGKPIGEDGNSITEQQLLDSIVKEIPVVKQFQVEFFSLTEIPAVDVLKRICLDKLMVNQMLDHATSIYEHDVEALLERLVAIKDPVSSEHRMHYLMKVVGHLNSENPDLVLEQNLEFFSKDAERWLSSEVCRERGELVEKHLTKPLGDARTLEDFFEPPHQSLKDKFLAYCEFDSPFVGKRCHYEVYKSAAERIFNESEYATLTLNVKDPTTGNVIGIMSYAQPSFEAKMKTDENVLMDIYNILKHAVDSEETFDMFLNDLPSTLDQRFCAEAFSRYSNITGICDIIQDRWTQIRADVLNQKNTTLSESMWIKKVMCEGTANGVAFFLSKLYG